MYGPFQEERAMKKTRGKTKNKEKAREGGPNGQECMRNSLKTEVNHIKLRRKNIILSRDFVKKFRALNRAGKSFV